MSLPHENRFIGSLIGQCLGDALGFVVEGYPAAVCRRYVDDVLRQGQLLDGIRHEWAFGQYSDDSQLARELLQSYLACQTFEPSDYATRIAAIFSEDRIVGRGRATEGAARRLAQGVPWEQAGTPPPVAGNGSAMRAGPIGLLFFDDPVKMIQAAHDQGRITHQDRRCSAGAIAIAGAVALALREESISVATFSKQLSKWVWSYDPILTHALAQKLPLWVHQPPDMAIKEISRTGLARDYSDEWQGISPFVTSSVLWSLYSFLRHPDNYWDAICTAIMVGGDVDTTAAMTGAISGARVGLANIPAHLAHRLTDLGTWGYQELVELARTCYLMRS